MRINRPEILQCIAGLLMLGIGVLVYLLDRPSTSVYLLPDSWVIGQNISPVFGVAGQFLPTFAHTFAFALFTSAVLEPWRWSATGACVGWAIIAGLFELAQSDAWSAQIAGRVPAWFADWPVLENVAGYFVYGRCDPRDLFSIALAAVTAWLFISLTHRICGRQSARPHY